MEKKFLPSTKRHGKEVFSELETLCRTSQKPSWLCTGRPGMLTPRFGTPTAGSNFDSAYQVSMYEEHLARIGARQGWLRQLRFRKWF